MDADLIFHGREALLVPHHFCLGKNNKLIRCPLFSVVSVQDPKENSFS